MDLIAPNKDVAEPANYQHPLQNFRELAITNDYWNNGKENSLFSGYVENTRHICVNDTKSRKRTGPGSAMKKLITLSSTLNGLVDWHLVNFSQMPVSRYDL